MNLFRKFECLFISAKKDYKNQLAEMLTSSCLSRYLDFLSNICKI